ncbi:integrase arm-type DNA-binding domain-containing protein [Falsiroseomonas sp. HW251]|uniref:integrase arm-type DNA-binding domain-containing protein n=1 Tax=Falsiroseomonas sp. HW251 TaxID=3390998 RepID=UPI003D32150D
MLRMTSTGAATWSVRTRRTDGKHTRPKLGTWPAMGIAKARKEAKAAIAAVQSGGDPVAEKRQAREARRREQAERRGAGTVASRLAEWQAARKADPAGPWSLKYAAE